MPFVKTLIVFICVSLLPYSHANSDKFYANPKLQAKAPEAFALSKNNIPWLREAHRIRKHDAEKFYAALKADKSLFNSLKNWLDLTFEQRLALLPQVFEIECKVLDMVCPELVINTTLYPSRAVNFVFDIRFAGSGLVYLNPDKLKSMEPYAPLAFLIHETRHAIQFQQAFSKQTLIAKGYKAAFTAQAKISGFSFSDFLTLLNEYEAFQFGNHVIGLLTNWQVDMTNMGTFASQFNKYGKLKIDLEAISEQGSDSLLESYNKLAEEQYNLRK